MKYILSLLLGILLFPVYAQDIDQAKLEELLSICNNGQSDALIILIDDEIITESYFDKLPQKIDIKSITKSITNLAVGHLVSKGKMSIDQKVWEFYPEWNQENKRDITVKHLLTHTSGMLDSDFGLVENTADIVKFALASDLTHPVGRYYVYNNKAVNLLVGIVEKVDGRKLHKLIEQEIFAPLGITDYTWPTDNSGNPYAMAFLQMYPMDLVKIGQFVLARGKWKGVQLINASWFDLSLSPGADFMPEYGLLWELLTENFRVVVDDEQISKMVSQGVQADMIAKTESMKGVYNGYGAYFKKLREVFGKDSQELFQQKLVPFGLSIGRKKSDGVTGYAGIGYLGQYLVIYPDQKLIAFRGINYYEGYNWDTDEITEFPRLIMNLVSP